MSLTEIIEIKDRRTPEYIESILATQMEKIENKIDDWVAAKKLLLTLQKVIHSTRDTDIESVTIKYCPAESIVIGDINDFSGKRTDYDALQTFYYSMRDKYPNLDLNYPVWGKFSIERVLRGDWRWPDRFYFHNPEGLDKRQAAFYAIGYARGGYGQTDELYGRLLKYVDENGFEVCGDAFEEYPLSELSAQEDNKYLIRVMITVREVTEGSKGLHRRVES